MRDLSISFFNNIIFLQKYPDPVIKRPPRYLPPVRRTRSGRSSPAPNQQNKLRQGAKQLVVPPCTAPKNEGSRTKTKTPITEEKPQTETLIKHQTDGGKNVDTLASAQPPPAPPLPQLPPPPPPPPPPLAPPQVPKQAPKPLKVESQTVPRKHGKVESSANAAKQKGGSDTLDLNQIIQARQNLRKRDEDSPTEKSSSNVNDDLMSLIRSGVKLKKVEKRECQKEQGLSDIAASMLRNTLAKMNKHMSDSSDEDVGNDDEEFI